jgi:hypothetical protein
VTARYESVGAGFPRLKFRDFQLDRTPDGKCRARVVLGWSDGREYVGEAAGMSAGAGEMRCAAAATVEAIGKVASDAAAFELLGVKAVRAFDQTVVIVSLSARERARGLRLVGSYLTESDAPHGAALAVLNATNRVMGNFFATR